MTDKNKILVVDDTPASLKLLTDILTDEGYEVCSAISGELALRAAANNPPELVLLDIRMPSMDGYEVSRRLKADPTTRNVPVIFVSAASETAETVKGFEHGAVDFVTKPYQRDELLARVRTHLELYHLRNHLESLVEARTTELMERKNLFKTIIDTAPMRIFWKDKESRYLGCNPVFARDAGEANPEDLLGKDDSQLCWKAQSELYRADDKHVMDSGVSKLAFDEPQTTLEGKNIWLRTSKVPLCNLKNETIGVLGIYEDITERKQSELNLRLYERALNSSINSIVIVDATQRELPIVYVNSAFTSTTGYSVEEALGRNPRFLKGSDRDQVGLADIRGAVRERRNGKAVLRNYRKDGSLFWNELYVSPVLDDTKKVTHFIGVGRDVTQRKFYEAELERMTNFDTLTALPNRNLFNDRLSQAVVHAQRSSGIMAVAVLNLDGFRLVNDSLGHHAGDMLLQEVAHRLSACVRAEDTVARLGADEFGILMPFLTKAQDTVAIMEKLLETFSVPLRCDTNELYITASIGIAVYLQDGDDAEVLFKHADLAMHRAKELGRNRYQFYTVEMNRHVSEGLILGNDLHRALARNELTLHYQPQVDLQSGQIVGLEALLRWEHPESGWISPARFIPIAEECGLIVLIGKWVLQQACQTAKGWHDQGFAGVVGVNLSAKQIREPGFVKSVQDALHSSGLEARYLELELTEGILIEQTEFVFEVLAQLREIGVVLSLDDFGTGYSSLSYLKRFPIGRLKIDQSFVRNIVSDPEDAAIVGAIISMARSLRLKVIAEGVETPEQLGFLRSHYCDEIQGYYFSKPLPAQDISAMLQQGKMLESNGNADAHAPVLLLVDDEENILNSLVRVLRREGYRILTTTSAREALGILACHEVGVIISDQRMPEMNGVEFLRRAKQLHPDSIRIVLSGYSDLNSVTSAINEGAVFKFFTKPWDDEQLRNQIREAFLCYAKNRKKLDVELVDVTICKE